MSDPIISIENLGKCYRLRHEAQAPYHTLRETLSAKARQLIAPRKHRPPRVTDEQFWALRDVNLEISRGDVVGIIGRNGAGKSTLLKVLSRITEPTTGRVRLRGRVASLLEVGTGFHPELTGRENIFLNGAILGMTKSEIRTRFDEIVEFAEVERFLDTPVKHYSSGMYVRLAFAVAAHLEPEILIIDEVLAVGDSNFQKKCLGKIQSISTDSGRTVMFVSHNLAAVDHLCRSAVMLADGRVHTYGATGSVLAKYRDVAVGGDAVSQTQGRFSRPSWAKPVITKTTLRNASHSSATSVAICEQVTIEATFATPDGSLVAMPCLGVVINNSNGVAVAAVNMRMTGSIKPWRSASGTIRCTFDDLHLTPGRYSVDLWFGDGLSDIDMVQGSLVFDVEPTDIYGSGVPPFSHLGIMVVKPRWILK